MGGSVLGVSPPLRPLRCTDWLDLVPGDDREAASAANGSLKTSRGMDMSSRLLCNFFFFEVMFAKKVGVTG
jgi:hypothetical protein